MAKEDDIFKKPPLRYLGYANEVGEAFRGIIPNIAVLFSYGIATSYVIAHTVDNVFKAKKNEPMYAVIYTGLDTFIWQILASVIIPGYTINRSCYCISVILNRSQITDHRAKIMTTGFVVLMIPFIIKPIDKSVDYIMDKAIRPSLKKMIDVTK